MDAPEKTMANFFDEPDLCVKIIRHAIEREYESVVANNRPGFGWWLKNIQKYGQVSKRWKSMILSSPKLFKPLKNWQEPWADASASSIKLDTDTVESVKKLVKEGYLQVAKHMHIDFGLTIDDIGFILSHAAGNQIEAFEISVFENDFVGHDLDTILLNMNRFHGLLNIFMMSRNARSFYFVFWGEDDEDDEKYAKLFWMLLHGAVHCNIRPKQIVIDCYGMPNEWSFTRQYAHVNTGSIEHLYVRHWDHWKKSPNFSHLAHVETLQVGEKFFGKNSEMISKMGVKWLKIHVNPLFEESCKDWREEYFEIPIQETHKWPTNPATESVTMILKLTHGEVEYRGALKEWTKTFDSGDASLWENVRIWMKNVQYEWEQLDGIDDWFENGVDSVHYQQN